MQVTALDSTQSKGLFHESYFREWKKVSKTCSSGTRLITVQEGYNNEESTQKTLHIPQQWFPLKSSFSKGAIGVNTLNNKEISVSERSVDSRKMYSQYLPLLSFYSPPMSNTLLSVLFIHMSYSQRFPQSCHYPHVVMTSLPRVLSLLTSLIRHSFSSSFSISLYPPAILNTHPSPLLNLLIIHRQSSAQLLYPSLIPQSSI